MKNKFKIINVEFDLSILDNCYSLFEYFLRKIIFIILPIFVLYGCGEPDTSRSEMNPRKKMIYGYAYNLVEIDSESAVSGNGILPSHPSRLKEPYPTREEMEAAIGKADFSQFHFRLT